MDSEVSEGEQDGTQRWFAGLPSVGVIPPGALTVAHRDGALHALRRARHRRALIVAGGMVCALAAVAVALGYALMCPSVPVLLVIVALAPRTIAQASRVRTLPEWADERGVRGTVESFEGDVTFRDLREFDQLSGKVRLQPGQRTAGRLRLDVLVETGLVLAVDGKPPKRDHCYRIQTTSDRLGGTDQGVTRRLATNERVELMDLMRHDPAWRSLVSAVPALVAAVALAYSVLRDVGAVVVLALSVALTAVVAASDVVAARRRRRQVQAALGVATVVGGMNRYGEQVEVLLPGKLLWTVGGRPAPERLRERSQALSATLGETHAPTTF